MEEPPIDTPTRSKQLQEVESLLPETPLHSAAFSVDVPTYQSPDEARRARQSLYLSHFLSAWGSRAWEFTVGLVMLEVRPTSLLLVALFGLADAGAQLLFVPVIGTYLDRTPRLKGACAMYALQNTAVAVSAAAALCILNLHLEGGPAFDLLVGLAIAAGSLSSVGAAGATITVEREWTKALSNHDSHALAVINAGMKRIDLTALIASPIAVGILMTWGHIQAAVLAIVVYNLGVWLPERALLVRAQAASPALQAEKSSAASLESLPSSPMARLSPGVWVDSFRAYVQQPCMPAAVALALLYLTVMSFGSLMTAYLKWRGMREVTLAVYRG
jgi:solute carrier family 40 (iron-regulated transporter), member 1